MQSLKGKWALVTGASSGIGREFAHALAERGANLVLVARRVEPMAVLAHEVQARHGVDVKVLSADLSVVGAAASLEAQLSGQGVAVDVLVNNAGMGVIGDFLEQAPASLSTMLNLNVIGLTELTQVFAAPMKARGGGYILLVASVAAFQPCPLFAAYAASKAYVLSFGEALHTELAPYGVVVSVLSPGVTDTEFLQCGRQPAERRDEAHDDGAATGRRYWSGRAFSGKILGRCRHAQSPDGLQQPPAFSPISFPGELQGGAHSVKGQVRRWFDTPWTRPTSTPGASRFWPPHANCFWPSPASCPRRRGSPRRRGWRKARCTCTS